MTRTARTPAEADGFGTPTEVTSPAAPPGRTGRGCRGGARAVLVPLMLVAFIATLDQTIVVTALPGIGRALHGITPPRGPRHRTC